MRVLITGAAGFIGSHLADHFIAAGDDVYGIDNFTTGRVGNVPTGVRFMEGSITDPVAVGAVFEAAEPDVVYHCAASYKDPEGWETDAATNVLGTVNVVRGCLDHRVHRIVYFQTSLCYGINPRSPVPVTAPLDPTSSYAISKTAGEQYIRMSGLDWVSLRLANIFGPRNLSGPIPTFYRRLTEGLPVTVVDTRRDFVYIDDLITVATRMATEGPGGVWHVGSGRDVTIAEVYEQVRESLGLDHEDIPVTPRGSDDAETILIDPSRTEAEFGWRAMYPMDRGIANAVAWYQVNGVTDTFTHLREPVRS